jgi:4-amino-4-deoxy-L-arabinose transferase
MAGAEARRLAGWALGIYAVLFLAALPLRPLMLPDELRYAEIPREMLASGDWIVPRLDGFLYFEKPVLGYWLNAISQSVFGAGRFGVRFTSALASGLCALVLYLLARASGARGGRREDRVAPLAALVLVSTVSVVAIGTTPVLDPVLTLFLTASLAAFFLASCQAPGSSRERAFLAVAGVACGLAFLTKGFLAPVLVALVVGPYLVLQRRFADLLRMAWLPLVAALATALPWALLVHRADADFWRYFVWEEHIRRFLAADAQHPEPPWYYLEAAPLLFLPWSFVGLAAMRRVPPFWRPRSDRQRLTLFALCWLVLPFLFFSASSGKLLTYLLPVFPPFALLTALGIAAEAPAGEAQRDETRGRRIAAGATAALFAVLAAGLAWFQLGRGDGLGFFAPSWKFVLLSIGFVAAAASLAAAARLRDAARAAVAVAVAPVALLLALQLSIPEPVLARVAPGELLTRQVGGASPSTLVLSDGFAVRAVSWWLRRSDVVLVGDPGELAYGLARAGVEPLTPEQAAARIRSHQGTVLLVAEGRRYAQWKASLPPPASEDRLDEDGVVVARY